MQQNKGTQGSSVKNIRDEGRTRRKGRTGREVFKRGRRRLREQGIQKESDPERRRMERGVKIEKEGVIPGRIWLVSDSLWGELRCNPLLSMQTWAGFHQIPVVTENHRG